MELADDFQNIMKSLDKIKSIEEMSLAGGDYKRSKFEMRSEEKLVEKFQVKEEKKPSKEGLQIYCYVLQILQIFIGWFLKYSTLVFAKINDFIEEMVALSFYELSEEFQALIISTDNFQALIREFIKSFTAKKAAQIIVLLCLPPVYAILKIFLTFSKFLLFEIPFE